MKPGEPFRPADLKGTGIYPPAIVGRQPNKSRENPTGITDGQKRLYDVLYNRAGENDSCWPGYEQTAYDLGKCVRQVKADTVVLERLGLIRHSRRRRGSNVYEFLWHSMFEVQPTAHQEPNHKVQPAALQEEQEVHPEVLEVQSSVSKKCSPLHTNYSIELSQGTFSSSSAEGVAHETALMRTNHVSEERTETPTEAPDTPEEITRELVAKFFREGLDSPMPAGSIPAAEIAATITAVGITPEDFGFGLVMFLSDYRDKLRGQQPLTWKHLLTSLTRWITTPHLLTNIQDEKRAAVERKPEVPRELQPVNPAAMYDGGFLTPVQEERISWVRRQAAEMGVLVLRGKLAEWRQQAERALPHCSKCDCRGCIETSDYVHPEPCGCVWTRAFGYERVETTA
jgi:hypothetical protein